MSSLVCIVGMCGAGKSAAAEYLLKQRSYHSIRFGQIVLDKIHELGQAPSEALEREIREGMRKEYGMAAFAILNMPKIDELLLTGDVIADGLYSWEEFVVLKEKYGAGLKVVAVYAPPAVRYQRLVDRASRHGNDPQHRFRNFTEAEAASRDTAEIENSDKGGPIAMADFTLVNTGTLTELYRQIDTVLLELHPPKA